MSNAEPSAADLRAEFLLRQDVVFLNHGSYGACPRPVFAAYQRWQRELEAQPVAFLARERGFASRMRAARAQLASFVGAGTDDLVFVTNTTTGLNVVAQSLRLAVGDEVLTSDHEYGALDRTWSFLCAKVGARYRHQPLPLPVVDQDQIVEALWQGVNDRTRVLFLSHITSPTALILPVGELVRRARERGIVTVIDGAHAPGQIDLDLSSLGADFYVGNCHKWLLAPKGAAFLYARPQVQELLEPLVVSWGWQSDDPGPSRFVDEQEWTGTRDPAAFLAVPEAIAFQAEHDWPAVRRRCHELLCTAREQISRLTGLAPICPADPAYFAQMHALPLPLSASAAADLQRRLLSEHAIEIPVTHRGDEQFLRLSIQAYNGPEDVAALVQALRTLL